MYIHHGQRFMSNYWYINGETVLKEEYLNKCKTEFLDKVNATRNNMKEYKVKQYGDRIEWYLNDKLHREDGPAIEYANGDRWWCLNGQQYSEQEFLNKMSPAPTTEWVLVECVSQFRTRYMVEAPRGKSEWALDTVVMNDAEEFSQEHLGETIVSHRTVSQTEALELCDRDNDYCKSWSDEDKIKTFFTKWPDHE